MENDPVNWVDPLGLLPEVPGDGKPHVPDPAPKTVVTGSIVISTTTVEIVPGIEVATEVKADGSIGNSPEMEKVSAGAYTTAIETFVTDGEVTQRRSGNADEEVGIDIDLEIETIKSNGEREAIRTSNGSGRNEATIPVLEDQRLLVGKLR